MQVSERTRSYLLVVRQTLLNTVPKAIVFHQVKQAEDQLLSAMQATVAGFEEEQLSNLLGEDPRVAETRKNIKVCFPMWLLGSEVHHIVLLDSACCCSVWTCLLLSLKVPCSVLLRVRSLQVTVSASTCD